MIAIIIGLYDVYQIATKGKRLAERKQTLEDLASLNGYSSTGWNRFREYQEFMQEYGDVVKLYEDYKANPWITTFYHIGFSAVLIPIIVWRRLKEEWQKEKKDD